MIELRCESKKHAVIPEPGIIEESCNSRFCGAGKGVIVIHRFDATTGELLTTRKFKNPQKEVN